MKKVIFITLGVIVGVMAFISICTYDKERIIRDHEEFLWNDSLYQEFDSIYKMYENASPEMRAYYDSIADAYTDSILNMNLW